MTAPEVCAGQSHTTRSLRAVVLAGACIGLMLTIGPVEAQMLDGDRRVSMALKVGTVVPGGEFAKYSGFGPSGSIQLGYEFIPGTSLYAEGGVDRFEGREIRHQTVWGPDMQAVRLGVGVERELIPPTAADYDAVSLRLRLGAGVSFLESDDFRYVGGAEDLSFSSTSPMTHVGVALGYAVGQSITLFADGGLNWAPVDEDKTESLAGLALNFVQPFSSTYTFPYHIGMRIRF